MKRFIYQQIYSINSTDISTVTGQYHYYPGWFIKNHNIHYNWMHVLDRLRWLHCIGTLSWMPLLYSLNVIVRIGMYYTRTVAIYLHEYPNIKVRGATMEPTGPRKVPCWPHEPCYMGMTIAISCSRAIRCAVIKHLFQWYPTTSYRK